MALQARVIGPETDLGHFSTLSYFGNEIGREFSDVTLTPDQIRKAEGNRFIELKGQHRAQTVDEQRQTADDEAEVDLIRERLAELEVAVPANATLKTLRSKLEAAEKAEAKRLEDEEAARQKAADEAQAQA